MYIFFFYFIACLLSSPICQNNPNMFLLPSDDFVSVWWYLRPKLKAHARVWAYKWKIHSQAKRRKKTNGKRSETTRAPQKRRQTWSSAGLSHRHRCLAKHSLSRKTIPTKFSNQRVQITCATCSQNLPKVDSGIAILALSWPILDATSPMLRPSSRQRAEIPIKSRPGRQKVAQVPPGLLQASSSWLDFRHDD